MLISAVILAAFLLIGCGKKAGSSANAPQSAMAEKANSDNSTAIIQPALTAWEDGDKAAAIRKFLETDWNARPLFPPDSALNLSEKQFNSLKAAENEAKSKELLAKLDSLKRLAAEVAQSGRAAVGKNDTAQAQKCFASLQQCGTALDNPNHTRLVQLVGQALKKLADAELAKVGQ